MVKEKNLISITGMSLSLEDFLEWEILISLKMIPTNARVKLHCLEHCIFFFYIFDVFWCFHCSLWASKVRQLLAICNWTPAVIKKFLCIRACPSFLPSVLLFFQFSVWKFSLNQSISVFWNSEWCWCSVWEFALQNQTCEQKYQKWSKIAPKWDF